MKKILVVALALVAAGCSRKPETPATGSPSQPSRPPAAASRPIPQPPAAPIVPRSSTGVLDACTLISPDDLKRITGNAFSPGVNTTMQADVMRCTFPRRDGGGVTVTLHLKNVIGEYRSMPGMAPVPGIADEAMWSPQVTTFVDRKGTQVLAIGFNFTGGTQEKWGEEIALEILPKL